MKSKIIPFVFLMLINITLGQAQDNNTQSTSFSGISIKSVSLSTGWYKPSMDYWNNTFLPLSGSTERFKGNMMFGGNIAFDLPYNLGTRVGVWYWQDKANGGLDSTFTSLHIGFTGISVGAYYRCPKPIFYGISPYAGIEGSYFIIQNKFDVAGDVAKMKGNDVSAMPFVGIEHVVYPKIIIGLEYGYLIGRYRQVVTSSGGDTYPTVSVNGYKFQFTIGYKSP